MHTQLPSPPKSVPGAERVSYWYVLIATTDRNPTSVRVDTQGSFRNTGPGERPGARALSAPTELQAWWRETASAGPDDYVLSTSSGKQHSPSNLRRDALAPAIINANALLEKDGIAPIAAITFHSLRRTYASIRFACGDDIV